VRDDPPRNHGRFTPQVLDRLAAIAAEDREDRFRRRPRWAPYRDRVLCVALCQGAAMHYVDGKNGVKDLDVYTFFAHDGKVGTWPPRWRIEHRFDLDPFQGHYVDLIGRSLAEEVGTDPVLTVQRYLSDRPTATARALAQKAAVILDPEPLRGTVAWPVG
jgi:hypothetical protein